MRILAVVAAALVSAAACGGGGGGEAATQGAARCPAFVSFDGSVDDHGSRAVSGAAGDIEAGDSFFAPTCSTGVRAGTLTLRVKNSGKLLHNFSVAAASLDTDIPPGQTVTIKLPVGTDPVLFFCKYHRTSGMLGALVPGR